MISRTQTEHEAINAREYPGTRQLCVACGEPTGRCEEDSVYLDDHEKSLGPLCGRCVEERLNGPGLPEYLANGNGLPEA